MTPSRAQPAILRVRRPSGRLDLFQADLCHVEGGVVTATGTWKGSRRLVAYSWPLSAVIEVRWDVREAVAA